MVEPTSETPEGFTRVQRRSPFLDLVGELYLHDADAPVYGLRIQPEHANNRGAPRRSAPARRCGWRRSSPTGSGPCWMRSARRHQRS
ncbi:MAG: hypothetical protein WKF73_10105 [Nocardioidaceae bacterium]